MPKGNGEYRGIGLVEVLWKTMPGLINRITDKAFRFQDVLCGFREGRGTGIVSLKVKLLHKLTDMSEEVIYKVFLDLRNSYDTLDWERCLEIMVAYGVRTQK